MKNIFLALIYFFTSVVLAADPPVSIKGQTGTKQVPKWNLQVPFAQATNMGGIDTLIETGSENILPNPGFEGSTSTWTLSNISGTLGGIKTTNPATGSKHLRLVPTSDPSYARSALIPIPNGLKGQNGYLTCRFATTGISLTPAPTFNVTDGTNTLATGSMVTDPTPLYVRAGVNFIFPTSGNVQINILPGSGSPTVDVDDCYIGPALNYGSSIPIDQWQTYTPTVSNLGSGSLSTNQGKWRRVGDTIEVQIFNVKDSTAGTGSSAVTWSIPTGLTVDTAKLASSTVSFVNVGSSQDAASGTNGAVHYLVGSNVVYTYGFAGGGQWNGSNFTANKTLSLRFSLPIVQWSGSQSTVTMDCVQSGACVNDFSAKISSTDVVTDENIDWLSGNCTSATLGRQICTYNSGFFGSTIPNCTVSPAQSSGGHNYSCAIAAASTTVFIVDCTDTVGGVTSAVDIASNVRCSRVAGDLKPMVNAPIFKGSVTSNSLVSERIERATVQITGASACAIVKQSGNWITGTSASGTKCTLTVTGFSDVPSCVATRDSTSAAIIASNAVNSATSIDTALWNTSGTIQTGTFHILCMGPQ